MRTLPVPHGTIMKLYDLFNNIKCEIVGNEEIEIKDLNCDSRSVKKGDLFFCITGFADDGHRYAKMAVAHGAAAIVVTQKQNLDITQVIVKDDREVMALCACKFFDYPARKVKTIGITGTNGKTTTTYMIKSIGEKAGYKVGLIGTIVNMIGENILPTDRTTPDSIDLQRLLKKMVEENCNLIVMEVSSHSLFLKRVFGIEFDIGIFSNLTQDHLDFHENFENYIAAKSILFEQSDISIINIDDDSAANMIAAAKREVVTYSVYNQAKYYASSINISTNKTKFCIENELQSICVEVGIPGMFTVYNAIAAAVCMLIIGVDVYYVESGLKALKGVTGRFELLDTRGRDFSIILDYAHTPDSLKNTLETIKGFATHRVVTIFGCGGNRDKTKRPQMAKIAFENSDFVVITSDNPRFEEPMDIIKDILENTPVDNKKYIVVENRKEAIEYAIKNAKSNDIILLAGKGHETYQEINGVKYDFDEKAIVDEVFVSMEEGK